MTLNQEGLEVQTEKDEDEEEIDADFSFDDLVGRYPGNKRLTEKPVLREEVIVGRRDRTTAIRQNIMKLSENPDEENIAGKYRENRINSDSSTCKEEYFWNNPE